MDPQGKINADPDPQPSFNCLKFSALGAPPGNFSSRFQASIALRTSLSKNFVTKHDQKNSKFIILQKPYKMFTKKLY